MMEDFNYKLEVKLIMKMTLLLVNMSNMKLILKLITVYVKILIDMLMLKLMKILMFNFRYIDNEVDSYVDDEVVIGDDKQV